jgi:hypothetical protein
VSALISPAARAKLSVFAAVALGIASIGSGAALVRHPARLVDIVTLFGGAFGAGAAFAVAVRNVRQSRNPP